MKRMDWDTAAKNDKARKQGTEPASAAFGPREEREASDDPPDRKVSVEAVKQFMTEVALARIERRPPPPFTEDMEFVFGKGAIGLKKLRRDPRYYKIITRLRVRQRKAEGRQPGALSSSRDRSPQR